MGMASAHLRVAITAMLTRIRLLLILSAFACTRLNAVTLDWSAVTWTNPGSFAGDPTITNSYDIDASNPGNDITVSITGNTSQFTTSPFIGGQTPAINTAFEGGLGSGTKSLDLTVNFTSVAQSITVTVTFSAGYTGGVNLSAFKIFDVDFSNGGGSQYQDEIKSISATSILNTPVAATVTGSVNNTVTGSGTLAAIVDGNVSTGDTDPQCGGVAGCSGKANATIDFGTNAIKSFTFTYTNGTGILGLTDPTVQHIGLYNLTFTPIPEIDPVWGTLVSCAAAIGLVVCQHVRIRKRDS
jgi:hypothetical protein